MARTTGTASLADLVKSKKLVEGEKIYLKRRSAASIEGVIQADGSIRVGKHTYKTPSAAAREALNVGSIDGWIRWRVARLNGCNLAQVRDEG